MTLSFILGSTPPTKAKNRKLRQLQGAVDRITDGDRRFFERHPERNYRLRASGKAEVEILKVTEGAERIKLVPGARYYTVVKQVVPGSRIRRFIPNWNGAETDVSEQEAEWLFHDFQDNRAVAETERVLRGLQAGGCL